MTLIASLKNLVPDTDRQLKVLRGPFRGGVFYSTPRASLRKLLGLYEHELNDWIDAALAKADLVIDVGANDGYFTFGAAAAMRRHGRAAKVVAFEPLPNHFEQLTVARTQAGYSQDAMRLIPLMVGAAEGDDMTTLDALPEASSPRNAVIKIDVEGAELDVLAGAKAWINPSNMFVIEVHEAAFFDQITRIFADAGVTLTRIEQQHLPILGREQRELDNGWLVTKL